MFARESKEYKNFREMLSKLFADKRKERKLSLRQVETQTNINNRSLLDYEKDTMPSAYHLIMLMEFYNISFEEIKELYNKAREQ